MDGDQVKDLYWPALEIRLCLDNMFHYAVNANVDFVPEGRAFLWLIGYCIEPSQYWLGKRTIRDRRTSTLS